MEHIVNGDGVVFANQIHCIQLLKRGFVMSEERFDVVGNQLKETYWKPTNNGRTALEAWQLSEDIKQLDSAMQKSDSVVVDFLNKPIPGMEHLESHRGKVVTGRRENAPTLVEADTRPTMQEVDNTIYGTRDAPVKIDEPPPGRYVLTKADIGKDDEVKMISGVIGVVVRAYKNNVLIEFPNGYNDKYKYDEFTLMSKPAEQSRPKRTPEQKQADGNMWEAVKFVWRVDDNASWKIARLQQFFLGTIKKTGKYKAFFDTQLSDCAADASEVVAFGHWYRNEYDNIPLPENGDKLRSHFETFRGSGEQWQSFMRKAQKTILEKIPKFKSPGIEIEREQLTPAADGDVELISEEQQQEALKIMEDLADKFGGRK